MSTGEYNVPRPSDWAMVTCLHCAKTQVVGRKAMSITCRFCSKSLRLEDIVIKQYEARRVIETCGLVTVEKKGHVITDRIHCGGLIVRGKVKGHVVSRGPVLIGPEAELKGDVTAPSVSVALGAMLDGTYEVGPQHAGVVEEVGEAVGAGG